MKAALTQTISTAAGELEEIRAANVAHNIELIASASRQGAGVICLGELFTGPYFGLEENPRWLGLAEDALSGKTTTELRETAKQYGIVIVAPLYEIDSKKRYNTAVVIDADGSVLGRYRKTHIPQGENEQGRFIETFYYGKGVPKNGEPYFPVFETRAGRIGINICYDRHFEGVVASLARAGAQIIFSPAVTFGEKSRRMWDLEFRVDAARHNVFIGGSNRKGKEPPWNQEFFGESHFASPAGERMPDLSEDPRVIISDLDLDALDRADRSGWNLARDRRPDIYTND